MYPLFPLLSYFSVVVCLRCFLHHIWTYKMPVRYILSSVWVRLSIFSALSIIPYVGLYVFSLSISFVMIEIYIYILSYYHHQIGSMNYYPLFRVRSWNNGVRCMSFYIRMIYARYLSVSNIIMLFLWLKSSMLLLLSPVSVSSYGWTCVILLRILNGS